MMFSNQELTDVLHSFCQKTVLIIGDVMLDHYLFGKVTRFSPEAPVPIVALNSQSTLLGGASNVALNIKALGANPILCSVIGNDEHGHTLKKLVEEKGMTSKGLFPSHERKTTIKSRVIGNSVQLVRVDDENTHPLSDSEESLFLSIIEDIMTQQKIDIILFQDYDKGSITPKIIETVSAKAFEKKIPITVDPKKRNFTNYKDVTLFKPNLKELSEGLDISIIPTEDDSIIQAIKNLEQRIHPQMIMLTLSENGIALYHNQKLHRFPAFLRNIADVSGAGDTVISVATLCLTLDMPIDQMAQLSNLAGGLVCEQVGVTPIDSELLIKEAQRNLL